MQIIRGLEPRKITNFAIFVNFSEKLTCRLIKAFRIELRLKPAQSAIKPDGCCGWLCSSTTLISAVGTGRL